ncbi:MAG: hypothetical protein A2176_09095 [Spirochaetes bacterium RBG_13_51_14]|nr:MAG: hypothetical protein A2176_09095 [Spirochaetes bacterium RBG_13_51_14]
MLIRKSKISNIIKKEKEKERRLCQKEHDLRIRELNNNFEEKLAHEVRELKKDFRIQIKSFERENERLRREIDMHYVMYKKLRQREEYLDHLSSEIEDVIDTMTIKFQETLQPFYRAKAKIEITKRKSDKKHEKVESIFRAMK